MLEAPEYEVEQLLQRFGIVLPNHSLCGLGMHSYGPGLRILHSRRPGP